MEDRFVNVADEVRGSGDDLVESFGLFAAFRRSIF
jgi:hypothetical protein